MERRSNSLFPVHFGGFLGEGGGYAMGSRPAGPESECEGGCEEWGRKHIDGCVSVWGVTEEGGGLGCVCIVQRWGCKKKGVVKSRETQVH